MGPVQGHQCPYDAPSVAEHFRKTGTVNLNPADVLLFRDSLNKPRRSPQPFGMPIDLLFRRALTPHVVVNDQALAPLVEPIEVVHEHVLWPSFAIRVHLSDSGGLVSFIFDWYGNPVIRINEDYICFGSGFQSALEPSFPSEFLGRLRFPIWVREALTMVGRVTR